MTSALDCMICLDKVHDPVVTPCGHLSCDACIKTHARGSSNPYEAQCPTCRAPFPIVTPDMSIVPKKYHTFISPPLRRVFLGDGPDSDTVIDDLNEDIAVLRARVASLKRDKNLLMDRCEAAQAAARHLTADERTARLARDKAQQETRLAKLNLERLRVEYNAFKSSHAGGECSSVAGAKAKRTSGQAALDDSPCPSGYRPRFAKIVDYVDDRLVLPIPKRARLRPVCAPSASSSMGQTVQRPPAPPSSFANSSVMSVSFPSASASSSLPSSSAPPPARSRFICRPSYTEDPRASLPDESSSDDEADNHSERSNAENTPPTRFDVGWKGRLRRRTQPDIPNPFSDGTAGHT